MEIYLMEATLNSTIKNDWHGGYFICKVCRESKITFKHLFWKTKLTGIFFTIINKYFKLHGQLGKI